MDLKYSGKTVRFKSNKNRVVKNTIKMITNENLNIRRYINGKPIFSCDTMHTTVVDKYLDIYDILYQIESSESLYYRTIINDAHMNMCVNDILDTFKLHSANCDKKYLKHYDVTKYNFYVPIAYVLTIHIHGHNYNFEEKEYSGEPKNIHYVVKIKGKNNYSHDTSQKFPLNVLANDSPMCYSPDWYLWQNGYIDFPSDNFYDKKRQYVKNTRRYNIKEIKLQMLDLDIDEIEKN